MPSDDDAVELFRGATDNALKFVKHATFEVGPSPDDLWAFRVTIHPFRSKAEAQAGIEKMKMLLRPMGFKFEGDPEWQRHTIRSV